MKYLKAFGVIAGLIILIGIMRTPVAFAVLGFYLAFDYLRYLGYAAYDEYDSNELYAMADELEEYDERWDCLFISWAVVYFLAIPPVLPAIATTVLLIMIRKCSFKRRFLKRYSEG